MECYQRFLNYIKYDTTSDPTSNTNPSTYNQILFAEFLKKEMESIGLVDIILSR